MSDTTACQKRHSVPTRGLGLACAASGVIGTALALLMGVHVGDVPETQWSYPHTRGVFVVEAVLLALMHLMQGAGFVGALRLGAPGNSRPGRVGLWVALLGLVGLAVAEVWSGLIADEADDSSVAATVSGLFGISSIVFALGAIVVGVAVLRAGVWQGPWRWVVFATGLVIVALVTPANISGDPGLRQVALLIWSVLFIPLGLDVAKGLHRR